MTWPHLKTREGYCSNPGSTFVVGSFALGERQA